MGSPFALCRPEPAIEIGGPTHLVVWWAGSIQDLSPAAGDRSRVKFGMTLTVLAGEKSDFYNDTSQKEVGLLQCALVHTKAAAACPATAFQHRITS